MNKVFLFFALIVLEIFLFDELQFRGTANHFDHIFQNPARDKQYSPNMDILKRTSPLEVTETNQQKRDTAKDYTEIVNGVKIEMVFIKGGTFLMGSPVTEERRTENETQHNVNLSDFYIGKFEVTVEQFKVFIDETGYETSAEKCGYSYVVAFNKVLQKEGITWMCDVSGGIRPKLEYDNPVIHVSWNDAIAYCAWLSKKTGKNYYLPTEAQWEYSCRAGTQTPFNTGNCLSTEEANYSPIKSGFDTCPIGSYRGYTMPVGSFRPNAWGLYDMHGNVFEWCADYCKGGNITDTYVDGITDPICKKGKGRIYRGGGWGYFELNCRSACRGDDIFGHSYEPVYQDCLFGFRLACKI